MPLIHCPICNRSSAEVRFIGELCEHCTVDRLKRKVPDRALIHSCRLCGRIKIGNDHFEMTNKTLSEAITHNLKIKNCEIKVKSHKNKIANVEVIFEMPDGSTARFEKQIRFKDEHKTCTRDYQMTSGYYEALIQLRGDPDKVDKFAGRAGAYFDKHGAFVAKTERVINGMDIYVSDKQLANEFFTYYRVKPKRSYTLYGLRRGKEVYRHTYVLFL